MLGIDSLSQRRLKKISHTHQSYIRMNSSRECRLSVRSFQHVFQSTQSHLEPRVRLLIDSFMIEGRSAANLRVEQL
jgi:hypothetical protein